MMTKLSVALAFAVWAAVVRRGRADLSVAAGHGDRAVRSGGVTDIVARIVSERMKTALGQSVIIENVVAPAAPSA